MLMMVLEVECMVRPKLCRIVSWQPGCRQFSPVGVPAEKLDRVVLTVDELEAIRLADLQGLYQEEAARRMGVSRQTFGRIISSGRRKVAQALTEGLALLIEGGTFTMAQMRVFHCSECGHCWEIPFGTGRPAECPQCHSKNFHRAGTTVAGPPADRGPGGCRYRHGPGGRGGRGRGASR